MSKNNDTHAVSEQISTWHGGSSEMYPIHMEPCALLAQLTEEDMQRIRVIVAEEVAKALKEAKEHD